MIMREISIIKSGEELKRTLLQLIGPAEVPGLKMDVLPSNLSGFDVRVELDSRRYSFNIKAKLSVTQRDLDQMKMSKNDLLAVVQLTDGLVRRCAERGISAIGLNGRAWIRKPGLLIDTTLPLHSRRYTTPDPEVQLFAVRSSRLARALLSSGQQLWTVTQLARVTNLSLSRVSNLLNALKNAGWVDGSRSDWRLVDPDALLDAWVKDDKWSKRGSLRQYASIHPTPEAVAASLPENASGRMAFTQWFAANLRYPYTTTPVCSVYRSQHLTPQEAEAAGLREVSAGGKLWVVVPRDEGVFQFGRQIDGIPVVSDVQIYLDLLQVGLRGPDQARVLREWEGFRK